MHADTVVAPGPSSFAIQQMALGGIFYDKDFASMKASSTGEAKGCVSKAMAGKSASSLLYRQLMCACPPPPAGPRGASHRPSPWRRARCMTLTARRSHQPAYTLIGNILLMWRQCGRPQFGGPAVVPLCVNL